MLLERTKAGSERQATIARWTAWVLMARSESPEMYKELVGEHPGFFVKVMNEMQKGLDESISCFVGGYLCEQASRRVTLLEDDKEWLKEVCT